MLTIEEGDAKERKEQERRDTALRPEFNIQVASALPPKANVEVASC
jgi:hypothetical protein